MAVLPVDDGGDAVRQTRGNWRISGAFGQGLALRPPALLAARAKVELRAISPVKDVDAALVRGASGKGQAPMTGPGTEAGTARWMWRGNVGGCYLLDTHGTRKFADNNLKIKEKVVLDA